MINEQRPNGTVIGLIGNASKRVAISQVEDQVNGGQTSVGGAPPREPHSPMPFINGGRVRLSAKAAQRFCNSFDRTAIQGYLRSGTQPCFSNSDLKWT